MNYPITVKQFGVAMICFLCFWGFNFQLLFAHESESENVVIIHVDENGFVPKEVTIRVGTEVVFENVGDEEHWPATDSHPSHTGYSGTTLEEHCEEEPYPTFDSCGSILPGDTWSFVFDREGVFGYHDHYWPHLTGEIVVSDTEIVTKKRNVFVRFFSGIGNFFKNLFGFSNSEEKSLDLLSGSIEDASYAEIKDVYTKLVFDSDPREAIHALQRESSANKQVQALCHDILHEIGHTAYEKYGSFSKAVEFQSDFCNSGYIHGVFESYFKSTPDPLSGLTEQCGEYASVQGRPFDLWQCFHGVGHGFMYLTGGDLDQSLSLCEEGLEGEAVEYCVNGVYMEVFNLEILAKEESFVDADNPFLTCSSRSIGKSHCYLYVPTYLSQTQKMSYQDIFNECDKAELLYKGSCIHGVGSEAMKRNMDDSNSVFALCDQAGFSARGKCISGLIGIYVRQMGSYTAGEDLCNSAPKEHIKTCHEALGNSKWLFEKAI
ncbi:MAG: hypothetical protein WDZ88_00945 [Candidatus Paceibacterota bacterium]